MAAAGLAIWPWLDLAAPMGPTANRVVGLLQLVGFTVALGYMARWPGIPPGARHAIGWLAAVSILSCVDVALTLGLGGRWPLLVSQVWWVISYLGAALGYLRWPREPAQRIQRVVLALDTVIVAGGLGALQWALVIEPLYDGAAGTYATLSMVAQLAMVIGVNFLVLRGQPVPSRRGFRWFVAAQLGFVPSLVVSVFAALHPWVAWLTSALYIWGTIPMLLAHWFMTGAPSVPSAPARVVRRALGLNPLALLTLLTVAVAQVVTTIVGPTSAQAPLSLTLAAVSVLLVVRMTVVAREHRRLARVEATLGERLQTAKSQAVGRLAGGIAHQFNNLMTTVLGNTQLARLELPDTSHLQEGLADIEAAARRAAELTSRLLHYSGRQFDQRRPLEVGAALTRFASRLRDLTTGVAIEVVVEGETTAYVDLAQLEQLVLALTTNALAATAPGGRIRMLVAQRVLEAPLADVALACPAGAYVAVDISDTGCGIPPELLPHIFEPYVSTRPAHEGAGLGLAAVQGIVAAHQGGIAVTSTPGQGSRFEILFPVAPTPCPAPTQESAP